MSTPPTDDGVQVLYELFGEGWTPPEPTPEQDRIWQEEARHLLLRLGRKDLEIRLLNEASLETELAEILRDVRKLRATPL